MPWRISAPSPDSPPPTCCRAIPPAAPLRWSTPGRGGFRPHFLHGVWFSRDDAAAIIVAETTSTGDDEPAQGAAQAEIAATFDNLAAGSGAHLSMTGPPVFSRTISRSIQNEAYWIGAGASIAVLLLLYVTLRSPVLLIVIGFPAAAASIAGATAVQLLFGSVHGIALTFGMTLIGVTSDYPVHLIAHLRGDRSSWSVRRSIAVAAADERRHRHRRFSADDLVVFSRTGAARALCSDRHCRRHADDLVPGALGARWLSCRAALAACRPWPPKPARWIRLPLIALAAVSAAWMFSGAATLFSDDLSRLNPLPRDLLDLDIRLRGDLGAPDVRRLVAVTGDSAQAVLEKTEKAAPLLERAMSDGTIASYDSPSRYLPSAGRAAAPAAGAAGERGVAEYARSRAERAALRACDLRTVRPGYRRGQECEAALANRCRAHPANRRQAAIAAVRAFRRPMAGADAAEWREPAGEAPDLIGSLNDRAIHYLDLQAESVQIIAGYRQESLRWLAGGLLAVVLLLTATLKLRRAFRVILSLGIALLLTAAILSLLDIALTPFHIAALLLVAGIGLDYALFMSHDSASSHDQRQVVKSLLICAATTILAFFFMIFSSAPILQGIGLTVTIGVTLALLSAMAICPPPGPGR